VPEHPEHRTVHHKLNLCRRCLFLGGHGVRDILRRNGFIVDLSLIKCSSGISLIHLTAGARTLTSIIDLPWMMQSMDTAFIDLQVGDRASMHSFGDLYPDIMGYRS
jgi:hypothetical protein